MQLVDLKTVERIVYSVKGPYQKNKQKIHYTTATTDENLSDATEMFKVELMLHLFPFTDSFPHWDSPQSYKNRTK